MTMITSCCYYTTGKAVDVEVEGARFVSLATVEWKSMSACLRAAGACALMRLPCILKGQKYLYVIHLALRISSLTRGHKIKRKCLFEVLETVDPPCDMAHKKIKLDVAFLYSDNTG